MDNIFELQKGKVEKTLALGAESKVSLIDHISLENGLNVFYKGGEYPMKGYVAPEALWSIDIVKSIFIETLKLKPSVVSILSAFNRIGYKCLDLYFLKPEFRMSCMLELQDITYRFIFSYTSNELISRQFSKIFSHLLEYDNAYRLRLIDICSETRAIWLCDSPIKEVARITAIACSREIVHGENLRRKIRAFSWLLRISLLLPKARRAFRYALRHSNFERLQYDNVDKYWVCLRDDYDYMGMTYTERQQIIKDMGYSQPELVTIKL